jgi:hypothetical protein
MNPRTYVLLLAVFGLVIGGCTIPSLTINVDQGESPEKQATVAESEEPAPSVGETPVDQPSPQTSDVATPTNTLVVPPAPGSPAPEPPGAAPAEGSEAPASPIPSAVVDPELAALWDYALSLQQEVVEPVQEMAEMLEDLGVGSGQGDIFAICTGVDVVLASLAEVDQGLDEVGPPPVDDPDLQQGYAELSAGVDDLQEGFTLLQSACQTKNLGAVVQAGEYMQSSAQHMENAAQAIERWKTSVGL